MTMRWRIYYGDGSTYDGEGIPTFPSTNGDGASSPPSARDVQVIMQDHDYVGKELATGADYYIFDDKMQKWRGVDLFGLFDFLLDSGIILFGRTISNEEYQKILNGAIKEKEKNGWTVLEQKPVQKLE
jgi:hypothetical protein